MKISTEQLKKIVLAHHPQATLHKSWELTGGISAQTIAVKIGLPDDTTEKLIVRVHGENDHANNPNIGRDEFCLLGILLRAGIRVPKRIACDVSNQILPTPYILMEFIEGQTQFSSDISIAQLHDLVDNLLSIHQVNISEHDLLFLPRQLNIIERQFDRYSLKNDRITDALKHVYPRMIMNPSTLLHGDYWLGNILWRGDKLVGIIDWEDAMLGDPLSDLGKSRLELLWVASQDITKRYTELYIQKMPHVDLLYLPFWDLWGALRLADFTSWFNDSAKIKHMQTIYDEFVDQAIQKLQTMEE